MEEKLEYNFRGLGVLALCALLFAVAIWRFEGKTVPANGTAKGGEAPIYCIASGGKLAAVIPDAVWETEDAGKILEILETYQAKATFFVTEDWAENHPEEIRKMRQAGHELGEGSVVFCQGGNLERLVKELKEKGIVED